MPDEPQEPEEKKSKLHELLLLAPLISLYIALWILGFFLVAAVVDHFRNGTSWSDGFSTAFFVSLDVTQAVLALGALLVLSYYFAAKLSISKDAKEAVPGCLFLLFLLLFLILVLLIRVGPGRHWSDAFDDALNVAVIVLDRLFRAIVAGYGVLWLALLATKATAWLAAKKTGPEVIVGNLGDLVPVKPFLAILRFFSEAETSVKQAHSGDTPWFVSVLSISLTFGAVLSIETFLHLPPMTATAASALYRGTFERLKSDATGTSPLLIDSVVSTLDETATPQQQKRLDKIPWPIYQGFLEEIHSVAGLRREIVREYLNMSYMGIFFDWVYGIRSGNDLIQALPAGSPDRTVLKTAVDELEKTTKLDGVKQNAVLILLALLFGVCFWLASGRQWKLTATLAVSSILWTVMLVVHELALASASLLLTQFEAHAFALLAEFATLQLWLLGIIPQSTGLSMKRSWIAGTCAYALLQSIGLAIFVPLWVSPAR